MTKLFKYQRLIALPAAIIGVTTAWTTPEPPLDPPSRRTFLTAAAASSGLLLLLPVAPTNAVVSRAVGSGELECRKNNNCLEIGEWDGAVGWEWGGKDRCDPADPLCGADGKLRTEALVGKPVPAVPVINGAEVRFSHVAAIQIEIGRGEVGVLKIGLYGQEAPGAVSELVSFLSQDGFTTSTQQQKSIGTVQQAVSLQTGGIVTGIVPGQAVELGIPSQANAYAKSRGKSKAGDDFAPQPRPPPTTVANDAFIRSHDSAGLLSVPDKGLGYGGSGFETEDEAFESTFLLTDEALPALDKKRRVVGQVLDSTSMAFLERLANVPTKRGIRGVIPGQTSE